MAWNRWMADVWKQSKGRLLWSCVTPAMTIGEAAKKKILDDNPRALYAL